MRRELQAPTTVNAGPAVNLEPTAGFEQKETPAQVDMTARLSVSVVVRFESTIDARLSISVAPVKRERSLPQASTPPWRHSCRGATGSSKAFV